MYSFKIDELHFRGSDITYRPRTKITVLIGPNNSGKSQALREIRSEILGHPSEYYGQEDYSSVVFDGIAFDLPESFDDFDESYKFRDHAVHVQGGWRVREQCNQGLFLDPNGYRSIPNVSPSFASSPDWFAELGHCFARFKDGRDDCRSFLHFAGPLLVDYSGTEDRLLLSIGQQARGVLDSEYNILSAALDNDPDCETFSEDTKELFHRDVVLDGMTSRQVIVPRAADDFNDYRRTADAKERVDALSNARPLSREGDGIRGFVTLFLSLAGSNKPVLLIDEPETFLHPPHALRTGELIARKVKESSKTQQVFIATHSATLLQGLVNEAGDDLTIVRLDRFGNRTEARILENGQIKKQFERADYSPLYLDGLFSSSVLLVEGPRDASVYSALAAAACRSFMPTFVPTNGKPRIPELLRFYRAAGVRCGTIVDFDILNDKNLFKKLLDVVGVEGAVRRTALGVRDDLEEHYWSLVPGADGAGRDTRELKDEFKNKYKFEVRAGISSELRSGLDMLLGLLARHGVCVVSSGELESIFVGHPVRPIKHAHSDGWFEESMSVVRELGIDELAKGEAIARIAEFLKGWTVGSC